LPPPGADGARIALEPGHYNGLGGMDQNTRELTRLLDEYLIADLETMASIRRHRGGLGYPMLQAMLGGMELLGMLISGAREGGAFDRFWKELNQDHPSRSYKSARKVFRKVRNSTSHLFLVHTGVQLTKNGVGHMTRTEDGLINVDLLVLLDDFRHTYERLIEEVEDGSRHAVGYSQVEQELTRWRNDIEELAESLPEYPASRHAEPISAREIPYSGGTVPFGAMAGASATNLPFPVDDEGSGD
jgi:hypothetical protein